MSSGTIEIHQFCTGLDAKGTPDNWRSAGFFVGQYMNFTLPIPPAVIQAIRNDLFNIQPSRSEGPALIGREVWGESDWSVLAIVTLAQDESRWFPVYRYFLSEGRHRLQKILAWVEHYRRTQGKFPIFNPFDHPNGSISWNRELDHPKVPDWVNERSVPIYLNPGSMEIGSISAIAYRKTGGKQPPAWAFNIAAVEKPEQFLVIQTATIEAYHRLQNRTPALEPAGELADEQGLFTTIKSLMNGRINSSSLKSFASALNDPKVSSQSWEQLFGRLGAAEASERRIYTDDMVRLMTLRAIAIPEKLPDYLQWLRDNKTSGSEQCSVVALGFQQQLEFRDLQVVEARFVDTQSVRDRCFSGIEICFNKLISNNRLVDPLVWLLSDQRSLWYRTNCNAELVSDVFRNLRILSDTASSNLSVQQLTGHKVFWQQLKGTKRSSQYASFAKLFYGLAKESYNDQQRCYQLAAYFYQVSKGEVPKTVFLNAFNSEQRGLKLFDRNLSRRITSLEQIGYWSSDIFRSFLTSIYSNIYRILAALFFVIGFGVIIRSIAWVRLFTLFAILFLVVQLMAGSATSHGNKTENSNEEDRVNLLYAVVRPVLTAIVSLVLGGLVGFGFMSDQQMSALIQSGTKPSSVPTPQPSPSSSSCPNSALQPPPAEILQKARSQFKPTQTEIRRIVEAVEKDAKQGAITLGLQPATKDTIIAQMKCVLKSSNVVYTGVIDTPPTSDDPKFVEKLNAWSTAIYNYQIEKSIPPDGILGAETGKKLEEELKAKFHQ